MRIGNVRALPTEFQQEQLLSIEKLVPGLAVNAAALCLVFGFAAVASNSFDFAGIPMLGLLALAAGALLFQTSRTTGTWDREGIAILGATVTGIIALALLPEWLYGRDINAIIHHSLFSSALMLTLGCVGLSHALYHFLGATPTARDISRYPLIIFPVSLAAIAYAMLLGRVVAEGIGGLGLHAITTGYEENVVDGAIVREAGLRNHLLGTFLLISLTIGIALPIGVAAGMYMSEYPGKIAKAIGFSATMLRAVSVFILGATALLMTQWVDGRSPGDPLSVAIRGYYSDSSGFLQPSHGSFLLASCFLALLVIPVIARAAEEGLQSVPRDIREGSLALGATDGHSLLYIFLPWAFPVIITGVLVAAAEAAGSTAVLLFISGTGEHGISPFKEPATLDFMIFNVRYGQPGFQEAMREYQYTSAILLLIITLTLTGAGLYIKARARNRYRGIYGD